MAHTPYYRWLVYGRTAAGVQYLCATMARTRQTALRHAKAALGERATHFTHWQLDARQWDATTQAWVSPDDGADERATLTQS